MSASAREDCRHEHPACIEVRGDRCQARRAIDRDDGERGADGTRHGQAQHQHERRHDDEAPAHAEKAREKPDTQRGHHDEAGPLPGRARPGESMSGHQHQARCDGDEGECGHQPCGGHEAPEPGASHRPHRTEPAEPGRDGRVQRAETPVQERARRGRDTHHDQRGDDRVTGSEPARVHEGGHGQDRPAAAHEPQRRTDEERQHDGDGAHHFGGPIGAAQVPAAPSATGAAHVPAPTDAAHVPIPSAPPRL